jgi:hypothetical protein
MKSMRFSFIHLGCLLFALSASASSRTDVDRGWQFRADPDGVGDASGWSQAIPGDTQAVSLPHTWNIGRWHDYLGVAWYFRPLDVPPPGPGGHVELHFGATFYKARVWLNGIEIGQHEGGFTAYSFDITQQLHAHNVLAVRIDNRPGIDTIPGFAERGLPQARYDWWTYGGIVRDVWLTTTGPAWVQRQSIRSEHRGTESEIHDRIYLKSALAKSAPITVHTVAFDADNKAQASDTQTISLQGAHEVAVSLRIANPKLWNIDTPYLYRMQVELRDSRNTLLDTSTSTFGLRSFEIRDRHLLLNGERVRLTGMARHEDSPWEGLAETRGTILHDYDDMKALHTTLTRPVHYPQNPLILDYADRHGIVLIPEIPMWQFSEAQMSDPKVIALAKRQMREMIEEAGNHPSIFGWSVANESATGTPGGIAYVRALRDMIHEIDPGRPVTFADDNLSKLDRREQSAAADADFIMMNQYFGSWHGPAEALGPALDKVDRLFPDKMVIISEMGFAGLFAKNAVAADQARVEIIRTQMPMLAARDWIAGAVLWCYQDYKSPRNLWPGETEGFVDHGLVDENRQRRPSYGVWQQFNVPAALTTRWTGAGASPSGVSITVQPNTARNLPYYPLRDYRLSWKVMDPAGKVLGSGERLFADLSNAATLSGAVSAGTSGTALKLIATLSNPAGGVAAQQILNWPQ